MLAVLAEHVKAPERVIRHQCGAGLGLFQSCALAQAQEGHREVI